MNYSEDENDYRQYEYDNYELTCLCLTYLIDLEDLDINAD